MSQALLECGTPRRCEEPHQSARSAFTFCAGLRLRCPRPRFEAQVRQCTTPPVELPVLVLLEAALPDQPVNLATAESACRHDLSIGRPRQVQIDPALATKKDVTTLGRERIAVHCRPVDRQSRIVVRCRLTGTKEHTDAWSFRHCGPQGCTPIRLLSSRGPCCGTGPMVVSVRDTPPLLEAA